MFLHRQELDAKIQDEPRRDEQAEQQAPAPQGPVLPPPPPVDYGVFMQGLVQAMQTQAHTQAALQAQLEAQEGEMEQYLEEKKASQKRPATSFQRQNKKKAVYLTQQRPVAVGSSQVPSVRSPGVKKECPHYGKTHGGTECWMIAGKCLKCGSSDHKIKDCPRLQQTAGKTPVDIYTQARRPLFKTDVPVDSTPVACRQEEAPRTPWSSVCLCLSTAPSRLSTTTAFQSLQPSAGLRLSTGAPSAVNRRRESSNTESLQVAIDGVSTYHDSPYVNTSI
ncbi:hypothetical protein Taro_022277 [Colocasia esculenta]|uniref:CCHC-type domain-containing protein n=1 Tax=Colocasia esculenta TaxID=4460 RepID=A0A843V4W5_COLES|nr:hypothetical protein [Colocasia esculenta]